MSIYIMTFMGMAPFGNLFFGSLVSTIGFSITFLINGIISIIGFLVFLRKLPSLRESIRPIYAKWLSFKKYHPEFPITPELAPPEE